MPFDISRALPGPGRGAARRLDLHLRHAVAGRGLQSLHRPARARRGADAEDRQPVRLRAAEPAVSAAGLPEPASPGYVAAVIDTARAADRRGAAAARSCCSPAIARWRRARALLRERWARRAPLPPVRAGRGAARAAARGVPRRRQRACCSAPPASGRASTSRARRCGWSSSRSCRSPRRTIRWCGRASSICRRHGGNAFRDYQLPEAALALKQGVGRLIRSEDDYGVVVICDPRMRRAQLTAGCSWRRCRR